AVWPLCRWVRNAQSGAPKSCRSMQPGFRSMSFSMRTMIGLPYSRLIIAFATNALLKLYCALAGILNEPAAVPRAGVAPGGSATVAPAELIGTTSDVVNETGFTPMRMWYRIGCAASRSKAVFAWPTRFLYEVPFAPGNSWWVPRIAPPKFIVFDEVTPVFGLKNVFGWPSFAMGRSPMASW